MAPEVSSPAAAASFWNSSCAVPGRGIAVIVVVPAPVSESQVSSTSKLSAAVISKTASAVGLGPGGVVLALPSVASEV